MDAFLLDGLEIIFRLALAILSMSKTHLLSLKMEGMFKVKKQGDLTYFVLFLN